MTICPAVRGYLCKGIKTFQCYCTHTEDENKRNDIEIGNRFQKDISAVRCSSCKHTDYIVLLW